MFRAVITTDWHLRKLKRFFPETDIEIQMRELEKPFDYAIENGIKNVIIPGDISDKASLGDDYFVPLLALFFKYDPLLNITYVPGNHDFLERSRTSVDAIKCMIDNGVFRALQIHYSVTEQTIGGQRVVFVPYPYTEYPDGDPAIVFAHVAYTGALGDNGRPLKEVTGNSKLELHNGDVLISGHLHTHQYLNMKSKRVLFPGAPYQTNFGEQGPKGFVEVRARTNEANKLLFKYEFVNSRPAFQLINMEVTDSSQWDDVTDDPMKLYKISTGEGIVVPKNLTKDFPNVVSVNGSFAKGYVDADIVKTTASDVPQITPVTGLGKFLKTTDLSVRERNMARQEVRAALEELGLQF